MQGHSAAAGGGNEPDPRWVSVRQGGREGAAVVQQQQQPQLLSELSGTFRPN